MVGRLSWLSGRALAAQARGVLVSTPGGLWFGNTKLCDALRSRAVDQSRIALELEQQYQTWKTGISAVQKHIEVMMVSHLELPNLKPHSTIITLSICTIWGEPE